MNELRYIYNNNNKRTKKDRYKRQSGPWGIAQSGTVTFLHILFCVRVFFFFFFCSLLYFIDAAACITFNAHTHTQRCNRSGNPPKTFELLIHSFLYWRVFTFWHDGFFSLWFLKRQPQTTRSLFYILILFLPYWLLLVPNLHHLTPFRWSY